MIQMNYIKGATWTPRLFVNIEGKVTLLNAPEIVSPNISPMDLTGKLCQLAIKQRHLDAAYIMAPLYGALGDPGYLNFKVVANTSAAIAAGTYIAEAHWWPSDLAIDDHQRYQFNVSVKDRIIDFDVVPVIGADTQSDFFNGKAGVEIIHTGDGTNVYFPIISGYDRTEGDIGEITWKINSPTSFTVFNTGAWHGEFRWRLLK